MTQTATTSATNIISLPATCNVERYSYIPNRAALDTLIGHVNDRVTSGFLAAILGMWPTAPSGWFGMSQIAGSEGETVFIVSTLAETKIPANVLTSQRDHAGGCVFTPGGDVLATVPVLTN